MRTIYAVNNRRHKGQFRVATSAWGGGGGSRGSGTAVFTHASTCFASEPRPSPVYAVRYCKPVPPTSSDLSVFLRILRTNYGQKVKNTDAKSAPEGAASITVSGGLERYTEISSKIRRLRSLPTDCCKVDLEVLQAHAQTQTLCVGDLRERRGRPYAKGI